MSFKDLILLLAHIGIFDFKASGTSKKRLWLVIRVTQLGNGQTRACCTSAPCALGEKLVLFSFASPGPSKNMILISEIKRMTYLYRIPKNEFWLDKDLNVKPNQNRKMAEENIGGQ